MKILMQELERARTLTYNFNKQKSPLQSAEWVRIAPDGDSVTISASDPTSGNIMVEVPAEDVIESPVCVHAGLFWEMTHALGAGEDDTIEIKLEGTHLTASFKKRKYETQTKDESEFPIISRPKSLDAEYKIDTALFIRSMRKGSVSVAKDHPVLENVRIGMGKIVTADGIRMSIVDSDSTDQEVLIPIEAARTLLVILKEVGDVKFGIKDNKLYVFWNGGSCMFLTVVHAYPNHEEVLKTMESKLTTTVIMNRDELVDAMKAVTIVSKENEYVAIFEIVPGTGVIRMWSKSVLGNFDDVVPAKIEGSPCTIGVSSRLLLEAATSCPKGDITLRFGDDGTAPILVYDKSDGAIHIIMSMQIK